MPISVTCFSCFAKLKAPDHAAGKSLKCPKCAAAISVPATTSPVPKATPAVPPTSPTPPKPASPLRTFACPSCTHAVQGPDAHIGRRTTCPSCGNKFILSLTNPSTATAISAAPPQPGPPVVTLAPDSDDEERRPRRARGCSDARPAKAGFNKTLAIAIGVPVLCIFLCLGCCIVPGRIGQRTSKNQLEEGDRLFAAGNKAEAVAMYKAGIDSAGTRRKEIIGRIVDHEAMAGGPDEARRWVERAVREGFELDLSNHPSRNLWARLRQEREDKVAMEKEKIARAKRDQESRAQEAANETARKSMVNRANYNRLAIGMSYDDVTEILGSYGKERVAAGDLVTVVWQSGGARVTRISITFENGRLAAKAIFD